MSRRRTRRLNLKEMSPPGTHCGAEDNLAAPGRAMTCGSRTSARCGERSPSRRLRCDGHRGVGRTGAEDEVHEYDEVPDTELLEQVDEAVDEAERTAEHSLRPHSIAEESLEEDEVMSDPARVVDERALEEAGAELDDPDRIVLLEGDDDDPDVLG
jgi:hypothetical protein